jgi:uncharacterized membrane protein
MFETRESISIVTMYSSSAACILLAPGVGILMIAFVATSASVQPRVYCGDLDTLGLSYRVTFPTISQIFEYWPYVAPVVVGSGTSCLFTAVLLSTLLQHPDRLWRPLMAFLAMVSMWGVVGTSLRGEVGWVEDLHIFWTACLFFTSFALLVVSIEPQRPRQRDTISLLVVSATSLVMCVACSIVGSYFTAGSSPYYVAYELLAVGELIYIFSFIIGMHRSMLLHLPFSPLSACDPCVASTLLY